MWLYRTRWGHGTVLINFISQNQVNLVRLGSTSQKYFQMYARIILTLQYVRNTDRYISPAPTMFRRLITWNYRLYVDLWRIRTDEGRFLDAWDCDLPELPVTLHVNDNNLLYRSDPGYFVDLSLCMNVAATAIMRSQDIVGYYLIDHIQPGFRVFFPSWLDDKADSGWVKRRRVSSFH